MFCKYVEIHFVQWNLLSREHLFGEISFQTILFLYWVFTVIFNFGMCLVSDQVSAQMKFNLMIYRWRISNSFAWGKNRFEVLWVEGFEYLWWFWYGICVTDEIANQFTTNFWILNWNQFSSCFFSPNFVMQRKTWPSRRQFSQIWLQNRHESKYILIYILGHLL
jgi:hypothetical protein